MESPTPTGTTTPPPILIHDSNTPTPPQQQFEFSHQSERLTIPSPNLLAIPSITMSAADDDIGNIPLASPTASNPFNFQTQVISSAPVKSVSFILSLTRSHHLDFTLLIAYLLEHWPTSRSQIQAQ